MTATTMMTKSNQSLPVNVGRGARILLAILLAMPICADRMSGEDKPTALPDARAAVENNLRTPEGKQFDEKMGTEFVQKHLAALRQCKQTAGGDLRNFWFLLKLDKSGAAKEILLYPETKLGVCARAALLQDSFLAPPRPDYWVSIYMQLSH